MTSDGGALLCASEKEIEFHLIIFPSEAQWRRSIFQRDVRESLLAIKLFVAR